MEQLSGILLKGLVYVLISGLVVLAIRGILRLNRAGDQIQKEWAELEGVAASRGWTYERQAPGRATQYCGVGPMPGKGSNLTAWHHITGEFRGRSFKCFEYRYVNPMSSTTQTGSKKLTHESMFLIAAPGSGPFMQVGRPNKLDRLMGRRPRTLLGVPEFDEKFRVATDDEGFVRNVLTDDVRAFLLSDPRAARRPLRVRDDELFTWYTGYLSQQAIEDQLNYLCDVMDRIPAQAWTSA
ncbi:hypothetical protein EOT10_21240 [Streptomyces antnestii]|uniref:DUF3137 domain-containing protein n=1 Tax=Streptomyces antnestii TaxID=2494256 RepID=A0A3S2VVX4_9ACTN|nr:hypothetical protein [Streptomyces sp. San01]RVU22493.1 hypothetical protein EOT10_21240 [Streptomyces sp. San01]